MSNIPSIREKCTGALLASAIGDALGWPYEFRSRNTNKNLQMGQGHFVDWHRKSGGRYWNHNEMILAGEYSDDTQMILAVSRSLISGYDWKDYFSHKELPYWLKYERGGGNALKTAAKTYKENNTPWKSKNARDYFCAGGNGATMRILPHVIANAYFSNTEQLMDDVFSNSIITHGHPRAILGATCYAYALNVILHKETILQFGELINIIIDGVNVWGRFREHVLPTDWDNYKNLNFEYNYLNEWSNCTNSIIDKLLYIDKSLKKGLLVNDSTVLTELKCFDKENGAGDVAVLAALYLVSKYANNPILGIKTAAYTVGIDTDTIACITGGLFGMLCGTGWIPAEWRMVQDYNCLCNIAEILLSNDMKATSKRISDSNINNQELRSSPIGKIFIDKVFEIPSGKSSKIIITKICTLLGQTLYLKQYERVTEDVQSTESNKNVLCSNNKIMSSKQIRFNLAKLSSVSSDPSFSRITFKKIVQIINLLCDGASNCDQIAKKLKVDECMVKAIQDAMN